MASIVRRAGLTAAFTTLLGSLAPTWPVADIAYVKDEVANHEYDDALENLVALALQNDRRFGALPRALIAVIVKWLGMQQSPVILQLQQRDRPVIRA